jgi:hypothetical protein
MRDFEIEIKVMQSLIRILNESLMLNMDRLSSTEVKEVLKDIQICEIELYKLVALKERVSEACKEN